MIGNSTRERWRGISLNQLSPPPFFNSQVCGRFRRFPPVGQKTFHNSASFRTTPVGSTTVTPSTRLRKVRGTARQGHYSIFMFCATNLGT